MNLVVLKDGRVDFVVDHGVLVVDFADMYCRAAGGGLSVPGCGGPSLVMYRAHDFTAVWVCSHDNSDFRSTNADAGYEMGWLPGCSFAIFFFGLDLYLGGPGPNEPLDVPGRTPIRSRAVPGAAYFPVDIGHLGAVDLATGAVGSLPSSSGFTCY